MAKSDCLIDLPDRILAAPTPSATKFILSPTDMDSVVNGKHLRKVSHAQYLGTGGSFMGTAALCQRFDTRQSEWNPNEMCLAKWRYLKGEWKCFRTLFFRLDRYGLSLHDAMRAFIIASEGVDPCLPESMTSSLGNWRRITREEIANPSPTSEPCSESDCSSDNETF